MTDMLAAALDLAAHSWNVFPCDWIAGDHEKAPMLPSPGYHLATTDPEQIRRWWRRWPKAMIGAKVPDSMLVIDIDPRKGGNVDELDEVAGPLPDTLTAWSGRNDGGRHLYYLRPACAITSTRLPQGIDLKVNGYCIVPPSIHPTTGQPYRWSTSDVAPLPHRLHELLRLVPQPIRTYTSTIKNGSGLIRKVATATNGTRHDVLVWAAFRARDDGILNDIADDLIAAAASTGETEASARRTIASVQRTTP
jgi:hypothetical protein